MLATISFDNQLYFYGKEINDITADWHLTPKVHSKLVVA